MVEAKRCRKQENINSASFSANNLFLKPPAKKNGIGFVFAFNQPNYLIDQFEVDHSFREEIVFSYLLSKPSSSFSRTEIIVLKASLIETFLADLANTLS